MSTQIKLPTLIAHRGESELAPENTLESFALAWIRGAVAIEGDFHLNKDNILYCMHDEDALRTCGVNRRLDDMTAEEIATLDCGQWRSAKWAHTKVPTLLQVLQTIPEYGFIFIELKAGSPAICEILEKDIQAANLRPDQVTIISFSQLTVQQVKENLPQYRVLWLTLLAEEISPEELVNIVEKLGIDGVDCQANANLHAGYVRAMHEAGKEFHVWTVDDAEMAAAVMAMGVDTITTNRPYALTAELNKLLTETE